MNEARLQAARAKGFRSASWLGCAGCGSEEIETTSVGYQCRTCGREHGSLAELVVTRRDDMAGALG